MITYDILFSDGSVSYGVAANIAAAARRALRIAQREGIRVVSVSDRYAPREPSRGELGRGGPDRREPGRTAADS